MPVPPAGISTHELATSEIDRKHTLMNAIATRISTRCPTGIDVGRTASVLVDTYGEDAVLVAKKWATMADLGGDAARAHHWQEIVSDVERRIGGQKIADAAAALAT